MGRLRSAGVVGRLIATIFLGAFLAGGLFFGYLLSSELIKIISSYSWTETPCQILESKVGERGRNNENPYVFQVKYTYQFDGASYTSEKPALNDKAHSSYQNIQAMVERFPAGQPSVCLVNPMKPSEAILITDKLWLAFFLIIPLVFVLIGGFGVYAVWKVKIEDAPISAGATGGTSSGPISERANQTGAQKFLLWFFLVFFLVGSVLTYFFFLRPVYRTYQAQSWTETPCEVVSSRVQSHRSDDGTTYSIDILYKYMVDGKEFRSNQYGFMNFSSSGRSDKSKVVRAHPKGKKTVCFVNPKDPSDAVLMRDWSWSLLIGLIPSVFAIVGLLGLIYRKKMTGKKRKSVLVGGSATHGAASPAGDRPMPVSDGPVELKQKASPMAKLFGIIFFALFWNGIVSVFVWQVIKAWEKDRSGFMEKWFLPIFLIPFVLIGLGLIFGIFYYFLALFNPRPRLRLKSQSVALGDEIDVQWKVDRRVKVMQRMRIYLEGREEARYRRGTRTYTDKNTFARIEIANLTNHADMRGGQVRVAIPPDTMHSFDGSSNKILWTIHVKGDIKFWPDVSDEFPIEILPARNPSASSGNVS